MIRPVSLWIPAPVSGHEGRLFAEMTGGAFVMTGKWLE